MNIWLRGLAAALTAGSVLALPTAPAVADHPFGAVAPYDWACPDGEVPEDGFTDVPTSNVHEAAIDCAVWRGLASGTGGGTFTPTASVNRGQMATFVARLLGAERMQQIPNPPDAFDDDGQSVHQTAINQLAAVGLVKGTSARQYSPAASVSRAQMASYLVRAYELSAQRGLPQARDHFVDDEGNTHERAIDKVASMQLTSGTSATAYDPQAPVRRDQMARFLVAARGCMSWWPRDGQYHYPGCANYTDTEGLQALRDFDVQVSTESTSYGVGQPVPVTVQACNRRATALGQTFPQKDWFQLEARNAHVPLDESFGPRPDADRSWYDHRLAKSLDGWGYGSRERDPLYSRVSDRHPRLAALTWFDGPQTGPDDVVLWQPGECKTLDIGPWQQMDGDYFDGGVQFFDFPSQWRHRSERADARATPGRYTLHLSWGGVEVDQTRRYLTAASGSFFLDGPRLFTTIDKQRYEPGEPVVVTLHACNDGDLPYRESFGSSGQQDPSPSPQEPSPQEPSPQEPSPSNPGELTVSGQLHDGFHRVGYLDQPEQPLEWQPGECKTWDFTWDQRFEGGSARAPREQVQFEVHWNPQGERWQTVRGSYHSLD